MAHVLGITRHNNTDRLLIMCPQVTQNRAHLDADGRPYSLHHVEEVDGFTLVSFGYH